MQQQDTTPTDSGKQQGPVWVLASYGQRMGAWALDFVGFALPLILLIIGVVIFVLIFLFGEVGILHFAAFVLLGTIGIVVVGILVIVMISYIVWWLIVLGRGQTPGKQIVRIRVIKDSGEPSGWGYTFLREFVIKLLLVGFISDATFGIGRLVDYLWPLWDRAEKMQTLHDKLLGTIVVKK